MREFMFDINLTATVHLHATNEDEARAILERGLVAASATLRLAPNGTDLAACIALEGEPMRIRNDDDLEV